jgi:osmotically-inducible protein OsmY
MTLSAQKGAAMKRSWWIVPAGVGVVLGWLAGFFFDKDQGKRRRRLTVDRTGGFFRRRRREAARAGRMVGATAHGLKQKATHVHEQPKPQPNDAALKAKVESELFRPADIPKGKIDVNAEDGVVYLRGEADTPEMISELVERARKIQGVREVENLLHVPQ